MPVPESPGSLAAPRSKHTFLFYFTFFFFLKAGHFNISITAELWLRVINQGHRRSILIGRLQQKNRAFIKWAAIRPKVWWAAPTLTQSSSRRIRLANDRRNNLSPSYFERLFPNIFFDRRHVPLAHKKMNCSFPHTIFKRWVYETRTTYNKSISARFRSVRCAVFKFYKYFNVCNFRRLRLQNYVRYNPTG